MKTLSIEDAKRLLDAPEVLTPGREYASRVQKGPLRWYDKEMRCASEGYSDSNGERIKGSRCNSGTYLTVKCKPLCSIHALVALNELLVEMGVLN